MDDDIAAAGDERPSDGICEYVRAGNFFQRASSGQSIRLDVMAILLGSTRIGVRDG
jgi:hypothetical protein